MAQLVKSVSFKKIIIYIGNFVTLSNSSPKTLFAAAEMVKYIKMEIKRMLSHVTLQYMGTHRCHVCEFMQHDTISILHEAHYMFIITAKITSFKQSAQKHPKQSWKDK